MVNFMLCTFYHNKKCRKKAPHDSYHELPLEAGPPRSMVIRDATSSFPDLGLTNSYILQPTLATNQLRH